MEKVQVAILSLLQNLARCSKTCCNTLLRWVEDAREELAIVEEALRRTLVQLRKFFSKTFLDFPTADWPRVPPLRECCRMDLEEVKGLWLLNAFCRWFVRLRIDAVDVTTANFCQVFSGEFKVLARYRVDLQRIQKLLDVERPL